MAKKTQRERLIEALVVRGYRQVEHRSTRYTVLTKDHCTYYFVGAAGALRSGRTVSESYPRERAKRVLLQEVPA